ncbi:TonB-dependent receptor domain-containing protein [Microbulbifer marinus]|uniref:Outer membrane receptor proteins, mostly Fe transport n=1 Tax=Microbulbifer marinus TaxID=658218 RepID=A0A1H3WJ59_9GAMM|nr:TonB-dependent receptor [Microbulbifer marinus]SDZ87159.1 Outer membrane receptor proteins, mostly Fe transport [Microbulbifer marinus]
MTTTRKYLASAISFATAMAANPLLAQQATDDKLEEVVVLGSGTAFNSSSVTEPMRKQQSAITSVNALIDNLPGVSVNEGDTYGFDDWSTNITMRGFTTSLDEQQIGTTIDGIPNGGSNYGGGAKANRFIDPANIGGVAVSQGTADIASRSHEALGGTIEYRTDDPLDLRRSRAEVSMGEFDAQRLYFRYDTGIFAGNTKAWVSYSAQEATDWITETAENEREHIAAKLVSTLERGTIKAYVSYDDIHEDNYQRIYSDAQFERFPENDFLTGEWSGVPYIDQLYRRGWSTLRENTLAYAQFDFDLTESFNLQGSVYYHGNEGRGDWVPPYLVDVTDDGTDGQSEFVGGVTATGGAAAGQFFFVDANGNALAPNADCERNIVTIYGPAEPQYDPACYPTGAVPVMSYRHTHYEKERSGLTLDFIHNGEIAGLQNELRGGIWYEDASRDEYRDWHKITDATRGYGFNSTPYWVQYNRSYPQETTKWYLQDSLTIDTLTLSLGAKQFLVDVEREDLFGESPNVSIDSDSDVLLSAGLVWETPVAGTEVFAGYAENFKAVGDSILERPNSDLDNIEPETSATIELGLRYSGDALSATATYFQNDFDNRIIFLDNNTLAGPNYLIGTNGSYFNAGGIESDGFELLVNYDINAAFNLYASYTMIDASYIGTDDAAVDTAQGLVPGNDVVGIADQLFVAGLDWNGELLYGGISAKLTGDRYVDPANTWVVDSYTVTDAYLGLSLVDINPAFGGINLSLVVNNLFDEDYLGSVVTGGAWIGAPRTASLSATLDF